MQELGWSDALLYLLQAGALRATRERLQLRKYYFVAQPIASSPLLPAHRAANISVRPARHGDAIVRDFPRPAAVIERRFATGAECLVAYRENQFVGFLWLQSGAYVEDEVRCRFRPLPEESTVWDFDVHVELRERGSFVFARLWDEANRLLRSRGVRWSVSRISAFNAASLNAHIRLGAFPVGCAYFMVLGKWQLMIASGCPRLRVSLGRLSCPEIVMAAERPKAYSRFRRLIRVA